jgi:uridine kinase
MRRMLRDVTSRGRSPEGTELIYDKVEKGEEKFIMPYKYRADYSINTFFSYEVSVYKEKLMKLSGGERLEYIKEFIKDITPLSENMVPEDSLIREFIGNGSFKY